MKTKQEKRQLDEKEKKHGQRDTAGKTADKENSDKKCTEKNEERSSCSE